jgi:uncharacterized protein involved in exopolysaccharide biosynthesis
MSTTDEHLDSYAQAVYDLGQARQQLAGMTRDRDKHRADANESRAEAREMDRQLDALGQALGAQLDRARTESQETPGHPTLAVIVRQAQAGADAYLGITGRPIRRQTT